MDAVLKAVIPPRGATAVLLAVFIWLWGLPVRADEGSSILQPASGFRSVFGMRVDSIDPSAATNPAGAQQPGYRGSHQLVVYTPAFGARTGTGEPGLEAVVSGDTVTGWVNANAPIPPDGWVVSGNGNGANWIRKVVRPGARVALDTASQRLQVIHTPEVYINQVAQALARIEDRDLGTDAEARRHAENARACYGQLTQNRNQPLTPQIVSLADYCENEATLAYYRTVIPNPAGFRGVWLRPTSRKPEDIAQAVSELKAAGIRDLFLETYYQGRTLYPSQVMAEAGLPSQHGQFEKSDPLSLWIDEAHRHGLRVHAWVQVFFAGNARENIEQFGPILQKYPQWRNVQRAHWKDAQPVPSNIEPGHYFLDPANAEVRAFLEKLILEVVSRYPVDGLNLDYIRYPASAHPDKPTYLQSTWGYTETARQQFQALVAQQRKEEQARQAETAKKAGLPPPKPARPDTKTDPKDLTPQDPLWPQWVAWRKEQISLFVKHISETAQAVRPGLVVSAVVFPPSDPDLAVKLQDWPRWVREKSVQALTPIGLTPTPEGIYRQSVQFREMTANQVPVYVGIFGLYNRVSPVDLVGQVEAVQKAGLPGVVLFDGGRLTPEYRKALQEGPFRPDQMK